MYTIYQDIVIQQGADFLLSIPLNDANNNPINVSGMTANGTLKRDLYTANTSNTYVIPLGCALANGAMTVTLAANVTANLYPYNLPYVYDVRLYSNGTTIRVQNGLADIDAGVTGIQYANN